MTTVKLYTNTPPVGRAAASHHWHKSWRRMAQNQADYSYGCFRVVEWDEPAEFAVVINHPGTQARNEWAVPPERTILIRIEPRIVHKHKWGIWTDHDWLDQLFHVQSSERNHNGLDWYLDRTHGQLALTHPAKCIRPACSAVLSYKTHHPGHELRLALVNNHLPTAPWFDLYGSICRAGQPIASAGPG